MSLDVERQIFSGKAHGFIFCLIVVLLAFVGPVACGDSGEEEISGEEIAECLDQDGDGFRAGAGCDLDGDGLDDETGAALDCIDGPGSPLLLDLPASEQLAIAAMSFPGAIELCDLRDNDCDGVVDNDVPPLPCPLDRRVVAADAEPPADAGTPQGICAELTEETAPVVECVNGVQGLQACLVGCTNEPGQDSCPYGPNFVRVEDESSSGEICLDGLDNDCDGWGDEICILECGPGWEGDPCDGASINGIANICAFAQGNTISEEECACAGSGVLTCGIGDPLDYPQSLCMNGAERIWDQGGQAEIPANGIDDDCDGQID